MAGEMTWVYKDVNGTTDGNVDILSEQLNLSFFSYAIFPVHA